MQTSETNMAISYNGARIISGTAAYQGYHRHTRFSGRDADRILRMGTAPAADDPARPRAGHTRPARHAAHRSPPRHDRLWGSGVACARGAGDASFCSVVARVRASLGSTHFVLLEALSEHIAGLLRNEFNAPWVRVTASKIGVVK